MRGDRNTGRFSLPWPAAVMMVVLLVYGAGFATMGAWWLTHPSEPPEPGWPFVVIGSLLTCLAWAILLQRRPLLAVAPFLLLCLLMVFAGCIAAWRQHRKIADFAPVEAWVVAAAVEHRAFEREEGREDFYAPAVRYEYEVDGQVYPGNTPYPLPWRFISPSESHGPAREVLDVVSPGLPAGVNRIGAQTAEVDRAQAYAVEAYYNPRDPADSFLIRRYGWPPFALVLGLAVPLWIIAFVALKRSVLDGRRRRAAQWLLVAAWHAVGLFAAGYCLAIVLGEWGRLGSVPAVIVAVYELIGLIPLTVMLPQDGWLGRIKAALTTGSIAGLVLGLLGLGLAAAGTIVVQLVAQLAFGKSPDIVAWPFISALFVACAAAVIAGGVTLATGGQSSGRRSRHGGD